MTSIETQLAWRAAASRYAKGSSDAESFLLQELWRSDVAAADADAWCKARAAFASRRRQEQDTAGRGVRETLDDFDSDAERVAVVFAESGRLRELLDALPAKKVTAYHKRILLARAEGMSLRDIASSEGVSHPTIARHVRQAVEQLRAGTWYRSRGKSRSTTHCSHGHELSADNVTGGKRRRCRTCQRAAERTSYRRVNGAKKVA